MKGIYLENPAGGANTGVVNLAINRGHIPLLESDLYINHYCVGGAGGSGDDGTPDSHPPGFRKGIVIVDNDDVS